MSRRKSAAWANACALAALVGMAPGVVLAQGALGANFNEHFEDVDQRDLQLSETQWVRLFLPMPQLDRGRAADHGAVTTILDVASSGYSTILTFKFPYNRVAFPQVGSATFTRDIARLDAVLPLVMGKVDMLVIGNEPYIESREQDWTVNFNAYYEALANHVIAYRTANCADDCKTQLYMGALNRLDLKRNINPSTERWMAYVKATPEIAGVNIHPHVADLEASEAFLDFILPRMRPEQKFLVTEFSLIWWWERNMKGTIPAAFADKYQAPRDAQNWQIIKAALESPFPKTQWDDFLRMSPWFENRKHYLRNQMELFRSTDRLAVATYGFKQGSSMATGFGPNKTPWLINSVFAPATVRRNADGSAQPNYAWIDDFRALQPE